MSKTILAVLLCVSGILGYTHAATYEVYKASGLVATIGVDDPQAAAKLTTILQDPVNAPLKIIIYFFGFRGDVKTTVTQNAIATFVINAICIVLNWAVEATGGLLGFPGAMANAHQIAQKVGKLILSLVAAGVALIRFNLVGFSLGCHLAGEVGRVIKAAGLSIARIFGIECANFVTGFTPIKNLDTTCALLVVTIIANPGQFGTPRSLGHANVWLNYQTKPTQPNCKPCDVTTFLTPSECCSHNRGPNVTFEAFKQGSIIVEGAVDGNAWLSGKINGLSFVLSDELPLDTKGEFFCCTNGEPTYGKGTAGLQPNCPVPT